MLWRMVILMVQDTMMNNRMLNNRRTHFMGQGHRVYLKYLLVKGSNCYRSHQSCEQSRLGCYTILPFMSGREGVTGLQLLKLPLHLERLAVNNGILRAGAGGVGRVPVCRCAVEEGGGCGCGVGGRRRRCRAVIVRARRAEQRADCLVDRVEHFVERVDEVVEGSVVATGGAGGCHGIAFLDPTTNTASASFLAEVSLLRVLLLSTQL